MRFPERGGVVAVKPHRAAAGGGSMPSYAEFDLLCIPQYQSGVKLLRK
jgi:hypothetical protein